MQGLPGAAHEQPTVRSTWQLVQEPGEGGVGLGGDGGVGLGGVGGVGLGGVGLGGEGFAPGAIMR